MSKFWALYDEIIWKNIISQNLKTALLCVALLLDIIELTDHYGLPRKIA